MATYDISKWDFDPQKHYASVRMQQGRVLTDDDWNENERIENEERRRSRMDIIGPFGSPDDGFRIETFELQDGKIDFSIHAGTLHLGGWRLEMEEKETYRFQKDWLQGPEITEEYIEPSKERFDLVYLEAWQQPVSAVEDEALLEIALGGPDTSTRMRTMRRIHILRDIQYKDCAKAWQALIKKWEEEHLGVVNAQHERVPDIRLTVSFRDDLVSDDLCSPNAAGGYLGAENQAIRVQFTDRDHFTWGFDNAAPLYRVKVTQEEDGVVEILTDPKDQFHWPLSEQNVEILHCSAKLANGEKIAEQSGYLAKVKDSYNPDTHKFTLVPPDPEDASAWEQIIKANQSHFYLRVWNRGDDLSSPVKIPIVPAPVDLGNTGLQVTFSGDDRVAGDYWVITARPETPNTVIPWALRSPEGMPPIGVRRFFAPLAIIGWTLENRILKGKVIHDCRKKFNPLTDQDGCCTYTVGDGVHSKGDFDSIQEAIDQLPEDGGKICVLAGEHLANVSIINRRQIRISGCGMHTIIRPYLENADNPVFQIDGSQKIQLDNLTLVTINGTAIEIEDSDNTALASQVSIRENHIMACIHAISVKTKKNLGSAIDIVNNQIGMIDKPEGEAAIFSTADNVSIKHNRLVVVPPPPADDPDTPRDDTGRTVDIFDPCFKIKDFYADKFMLLPYIKKFFWHGSNARVARLLYFYKACGGIQIGNTSRNVQIKDNAILGGRCHGITLGHLEPMVVRTVPAPISPRSTADFKEKDSAAKIPVADSPKIDSPFSTSGIGEMETAAKTRAAYLPPTPVFAFLYDIHIECNQIRSMGLSGIGPVEFEALEAVASLRQITVVESLEIDSNKIKNCVQQQPQVSEGLIKYVGYGGIGLSACRNVIIRENQIEHNGRSHLQPCCGIFMLHGERIDISDNRILNNGLRVSSEDVRPGVRGAVVIKMAFKGRSQQLFTEDNFASDDGIPAIKLHDNSITQPLGYALYLIAFGPVSVNGNQLTSQGRDTSDPESKLAAAVYIHNIGLSRLKLNAYPNYGNIANDHYSTGFGNAFSLGSKPSTISQIQQAVLPTGNVLFSDNQITFDLRSKETTIVSSALKIVTYDDISFHGNQSECISIPSRIPTFVDKVYYNTFLLGFSIRANDNFFHEEFLYSYASLYSKAYMNTAIGNQSTHCLHVLGTLRPPNSILKQTNQVLNPGNCTNDYQWLLSNSNLPTEMAAENM